MTVRLPYDLHAEVARRAHDKRWYMSDYVAWCVEQVIKPDSLHSRPPKGPPIVQGDVQAVIDVIKSARG